MFLRNYYNLLAANACRLNGTSYSTDYPDIFASSFEDGSLSLKRRSGDIDRNTIAAAACRISLIPFDYIGSYNGGSYYTGSSSSNAIVFGSGDTPVTFDDYKLDTQFTYSVMPLTSVNIKGNVLIPEVTYSSDSGKYTAKARIVLSNPHDIPITVREFGLGVYYYLYYREVLSVPFTIQARDFYTFNYSVEISVPKGVSA